MEREKIERVARKIARVHAGEPDGTVRAVVDGIEWALSHQWTRVADRKPQPDEWCLLKIEGSGVLLGLGKKHRGLRTAGDTLDAGAGDNGGTVMREIKFRGKRKSPQKWVYGSLIQWKDWTMTIITENKEDHSEFDVNPETVGQYTGQKDMNGKEIYEGDFLKSGDIIFEVWWSDDEACYMLDMVNPFKEMSTCLSACHIAGMEVIGNRLDNPELLEKK